MIVKGGSRAAPRRLAAHLLRTDTNGRVSILELQSPHENLPDTFRDWQFLAGATRGTKGLYHANIDPHAAYPMTEDQWRRAADILEKELGLEGHPRTIVLHEKKGRQHIHVVWQRTNIDTLTLASDSWNYRAHEKASARMEEEFGHEPVPGKHAKRDRKRQADPPSAAFDHGEWQEAERSGVDPRARKDAVTALYTQSDSGKAFQAALESDGYLLAKGDRRDFVIVDQRAAVHSLGRQVRGVKAKELRAFMADIDREALPSVEQAKALQREANPRKQKKDAPNRAETAQLLRALKERHARERQKVREMHKAELRQLRRALALEHQQKRNDQKAMQAAERRRLREKQRQERRGVMAAVKRRLNRKRAAQQDAARLRARQALADRQKKDRAALRAQLAKEARLEADNLKERHAQQLRKQGQALQAERDRYLKEQEAARRLLQEHEQREREERRRRSRDGPRPPGRAR